MKWRIIKVNKERINAKKREERKDEKNMEFMKDIIQ
jgi:hypothetical protein